MTRDYTYDRPGFPQLPQGPLQPVIARIFCDAGTIPTPMFDADGEPVLNAAGKQKWHVNPSQRGVTWAWVRVDEHDQEVARDSGYLLCPIEVGGKVWPGKSDLAEFYAVLRGLAALPHDWQGEVATDNLLTIHRMWHEYPVRSIPPKWVTWAAALRARLMREGGLLKPVHMKGHPTKEMLAQGHNGVDGKIGIPVSRWNQLVDDLCGQARIKAEEVLGARDNQQSEAAARASEADGQGSAVLVYAAIAGSAGAPASP